MDIGAHYLEGGRCEFSVWAPLAKQLSLKILSDNHSPREMTRDDQGYWTLTMENVRSGTRYWYRINDRENRPDPASFYQPEGVLRPSAVIDHSAFRWSQKRWAGIPLEKMIIYELHIGTFTPEGTFHSASTKLEHLRKLGVNAVEVMPVAQFPGERNWGYDGVYPFAVQNSYGGPEGFKYFIDQCHQKGIAVILDVVYNHLGPEGNFLGEYMPLFTDRYRTPWGSAINFDDWGSFGVRQYFISNALYWFKHYRLDALRLDAIHGIFDQGAKHFLAELSEKVEEFSSQHRKVYLIAESDLNDRKTVLPRTKGGWGMDAQWSDDFHHSLHALLTGERHGYYEDFGTVAHAAKAIKEGFVYSWEYSRYRDRYHGSSSKDLSGSQFVICLQNHDQVGNRMDAERLSVLASFEASKLGAVALMFSPYIPLLFMGQEYAETAPFLYFIDFQDPALTAAVRKGRKEEFAAFGWEGEPPDPYSRQTFQRSKLNWSLKTKGRHRAMFLFYQKLIDLRQKFPAFRDFKKKNTAVEVEENKKLLLVTRKHKLHDIRLILNFSDETHAVPVHWTKGRWKRILDSADARWGGPGETLPVVIGDAAKREDFRILPLSAAVYGKLRRPS